MPASVSGADEEGNTSEIAPSVVVWVNDDNNKEPETTP
jgi:hypothetical protein